MGDGNKKNQSGAENRKRKNDRLTENKIRYGGWKEKEAERRRELKTKK